MKIIILGSGVLGVASAYYLARKGHEVTVVDRQPAAAMETSFGNAGEVSPGYSAPWAGPGVPLKAIKWLTMEHGPLKIRPKLSMHQWSWLAQMLANCTSERYAVNKARMVRIAEYSRDCLKELRAEIGISYDERTMGTLQLFRKQEQLDGIDGDVKVLKDSGVAFEVLDRDGCIRAEPGLARVRDKFVGGLRLPGDETGDCHIFTQNLAAEAERLGVTFLYDTSIQALAAEGDRITGVSTSRGVLTADRYVVALGSYSPLLLKQIGIKAPIYPVKGYSITVPITNSQLAPVSTVMDETYKIAITRLGDRIRVGGTAELAGFDLALRDGRRKALEHSVSDLFPEGGDVAAASFWCGLRPMTPDGTPIIGGTKYRNLWLNTGHGTLGWTMSCGSGRVLADLISGDRPDIDTHDLAIDRYAA
ncbi:D-amino acid dehydrogenase [Tistrella mobilis]|uniref:D-amino acid dehydrogenase n=1 Tax=Tistrella mobilis TaxID=171437 RepID=UPI0035572A9F